MPKTTDPNDIIVGAGSSQCNDHARGNNSTQILMNQDAYDASQISAENPFETYLGDEAQSHFDDLASQVKKKPPRLGERAISFSFEGLSATHSGFPDWGMLKQADNPIWERKTSITFEGVTIADTSGHFLLPASDTFGYNLTKPTPDGDGTGADPRTDPTFNVLDNPVTLLGAGEGASFLSSIQKGAGRVHQHARVIPRDDVNLTELSTAKEGFTVSGLLFPADRGTLALLRWEHSTTNLTYTPASSVADIKSRVVCAVNLSVGLNEDDNPIFISGDDQFSFPSKLTGQYDLYEMQTGKARADLANGGLPIASLQANKGTSLGSVRLLREINAAYFGDGVDTIDTTKGHLPVLGGAYSWGGASWVESSTNFLSYRLPMLASYEPSYIKTPTSERQRFFSVVQPASTTTPFATAGNYVTMGEDHYTFQVARFRHVVDYSELEPSISDNEFRKSSFALVHFKSEDAFEKLVRDGIAPSEDDLWSINFLQSTQVEHIDNAVVEADGYSETGLPQIEPAETSVTNPLVRPNVQVVVRSENSWFNPTGLSLLGEYSSTDPEHLRNYGYFTVISGVKYLLPKASVPNRWQNTLNGLDFVFPEMRNRFSLVLSSSLNQPTSAYTAGHYLYSEQDAGARRFNDPFDMFHVSIGSLTGEDSVSIYANIDESVITQKTTGTQYLTIDPTDHAESLAVNTPLDGHKINVLIYPEGDTGFCSFTEATLTGVSVKDPVYHYDGVGTSKTLLPDVSNTRENLTPSNKMLYHSARLFSLIESAPKKTAYIWVYYLGGYQASDHYFSIFRYDQEGFRVYQTLDVVSEIEEANTSHPSVPYPIYRASSNSANYAQGVFPTVRSANLEVVEGEKYYVEYGPQLFNKRLASEFNVVIITPEGVAGSVTGVEEIHALTQWPAQSNATQNMTLWDRLSFGTFFGLSEFTIDGAGGVTHTGALTYNAFLPQAFNINSFDMHEVEPQGVAPEYGNFLETETGIIGAQGLGHHAFPRSNLSNFGAYDPSIAPMQRRPYQGILTARKDTQERFLDESYRIHFDFADIPSTQNLTGSGLPLGFNPISLSVRDDGVVSDRDENAKHGSAGYLRNNIHWGWALYVGTIGVENCLQVRGLPNLADNMLSGGKYGQPRRGVLTPPLENYQDSSYLPNQTYDPSWGTILHGGAYTAGLTTEYYNQPNYDVSAPSPYREIPSSFLRTFDVSFSRSSSPEAMAGTSRFKLRLVGLEFNNFKYLGNVAPIDDRGIEIYIKVPGLTTWLDVGRLDGEGPSKQHINQDGAGCLISYQEGVLKEEALYFTDLELEVGGNASFFTNSDGECPVLVRVVFPYNTKAYDGSLFFGHSPSAMASNTPLRDRRGLVGIEVLRMSNGKNFDEDEVVYL